MPKQIQCNLFESLDVNVAHISGRDFYDGVNDFEIGVFIRDSFREKDVNMEAFKELIKNKVNEAYTNDKRIKEWRKQNTFGRNGKKYIPLCRTEKINHETPKAYLVFFDQWISKSLSYKDNKYIYCEEWMYKKISKHFSP